MVRRNLSRCAQNRAHSVILWRCPCTLRGLCAVSGSGAVSQIKKGSQLPFTSPEISLLDPLTTNDPCAVGLRLRSFVTCMSLKNSRLYVLSSLQSIRFLTQLLVGNVLSSVAAMSSTTSITPGRLDPWNAFPPEEMLFGSSPAMRELEGQARRISRTSIPVLLSGRGGTGKETMARWIHRNSEYASGEFVKVNCAAIPSSLLESELFGFEKGAFTGANFCKPGRVELAHRGTLFLDEIGDLDFSLQSKLLHFLQDATFSRIGDQVERKLDVRVLCATYKDLHQEVTAGRFRQDLYYRVNVFRVHLPLLSQRREDIPQLAEFFRQHFQRQFGMTAKPFPPEMLDYLQNLKWPGNMRELSNVVARYVLIGPEAMMDPVRDLKSRPSFDGPDRIHISLKQRSKDATKEMERSVILETLRANHWNRTKTAQELKISYRALIYKIRDAGLMSRRASASSSEPHYTAPIRTGNKD